MNQKLLILLLVLLALLPSISIAQTEDEEEDATEEQSGGIYPTELQGSGTNVISPIRTDNPEIGDIPKPEYTEELRIASQTQNEIRPNYFLLEGYVDISTKGIRLQADRAEYDTVTKKLIATGNVVLDQEDSRITGDRIEMDLETQLGSMYNVFGYVPPQIFFWGTKLDKLGDDEYKLHEGTFTECSQIVPHWKLKTTTTKMTFEEYVHFKNFTLKVKEVPIFYSPYMIWPIKRDRATGFLFPGFGPNNEKGFYIGNSFFWAMTRSMDSTFWLDHWAIRGWGFGSEYRFATGEKSGGTMKYYYMRDNELGPQWSLNGQVNQDLPWEFRLAGIADLFSSFEYIQDFDESFSGASRRQTRSQVFVTRNWSYYSLNVLGDWSETAFPPSRTRFVRLSHLPEVAFQSRSQQLGPTPFYWSAEGSFASLGRGDEFGKNTLSKTFQRYDIFPTISYPINYLSWVTFAPTFGYRITHYGDQISGLTSADVPIFTNEALTRKNMDLTLDFRGPNFGKIYETPNMGYSKKWKHAIEPQVQYRYIEDIEEIANILRIDDVDDVRGLNVVTYSITNLLYSKRPIKDEKEYKDYEYQYYNPKSLEEPIESAWEFISWRISQTYSFQSDSFDIERIPTLERYSPISSVLRINPTLNYNVDFRMDYDATFRQFTNISLGSSLKDEDRWYANVSYARSNPTSGGIRQRRASNQVRTNAGVGLYRNRYVFAGEVDYDIEKRSLLHNSLGFTYNDDCFTFGIEWRHYNFGDSFFRRDKEHQITFTFSLPNIGGFRSGAAPPRRY